MKTALGILILLALTIGPSLVPQFRTQAIAAEGGCCKVRESLGDEKWNAEKLKSFSENNCQIYNKKQDGDKEDHTKESGYVWWDALCKK